MGRRSVPAERLRAQLCALLLGDAPVSPRRWPRSWSQCSMRVAARHVVLRSAALKPCCMSYSTASGRRSRARSTLADRSGRAPREDHRSIAIRTRAGHIALDVSCTCTSWGIGMRQWNDVTTCDASLLDRGRLVLRVRAAHRAGVGQHRVALRSRCLHQTVTFADGETLEIESGYQYSGADAHSPRQKVGVRGAFAGSRSGERHWRGLRNPSPRGQPCFTWNTGAPRDRLAVQSRQS